MQSARPTYRVAKTQPCPFYLPGYQFEYNHIYCGTDDMKGGRRYRDKTPPRLTAGRLTRLPDLNLVREVRVESGLVEQIFFFFCINE